MTGKRRKGRDVVPPRPSAAPPAHPGHVPSSRPIPPSPVTVTRRLTRRELRQQRQRQRRRRLGAAGIAAVLAAAVAVALLVTLGVREVTRHKGGPSRTQTTVLLQLRAANGSAAASALLAHDTAKNQGVEVLVPSRLITDVCGFGSQLFGQVLPLPGGERLSRSALSDVLGVTVDGSWVLDHTSFVRLVDRVGGVTVDVDVDVVERTGSGSSVVLIPRGSQRLDGNRAFAFATYVAQGEDATAGLARLQEVLDAVIAALPRKSADVATVLRGLGGGSSLSLGADRMAGLLVGFARDARGQDVAYQTLPVVTIDSGGGPTSYRIDATKLRTLVDSQLAASVPAGSRTARNRVYVENGVGTPGLAAVACDRLVRAGFSFAGSGNAAHFGYKTSQVLVFDASPASVTLGRRVATALRLPPGDVEVSTRGQNVADVVVILGADFRP